MVHLVWIGGTGVLQSILSSLILKVYHAFGFNQITIKFGKFPNFWMLFQMTCPIFNLIDIESSYQEKICSYPVPCSFRTWPIGAKHRITAKSWVNLGVRTCEIFLCFIVSLLYVVLRLFFVAGEFLVCNKCRLQTSLFQYILKKGIIGIVNTTAAPSLLFFFFLSASVTTFNSFSFLFRTVLSVLQ